MGRRIAAISTVAVLCVTALLLSSQTEHGAETDKNSSDPKGCLTIALVNNSCGDSHTDSAKNNSPHWYATPEWWLVIVAVPSIILIWYQARETARAARATQRSVELQEVLNRQWIVVEKWTARAPGFVTGTKQIDLNIAFDIEIGRAHV